MQSHDAQYADVEGRSYHYPLHIPNARQIQLGDVLVAGCHG